MSDAIHTTIPLQSVNLPTVLAYSGTPIRERGEMLSLTDMWKAAGGDDQKGPAKWRALPTSKAFVEHVGTVVGKSDNALFRSQRGGPDQGTWAHWHIAMAYAKYLDHDFHMWCNEVVRERMEGRSVPTAALSADVLEMLRRTDGMSRMMAHKVTEMQKSLPALAAQIASEMLPAMVQAALGSQTFMIRRGKTAGQIWRDQGFPRMRVTCWFGNRLDEMGCRMEGGGCAEMGLSKARLFDPDKADAWLKNGGRLMVRTKIAERQGQGVLRLVSKEGRPERSHA